MALLGGLHNVRRRLWLESAVMLAYFTAFVLMDLYSAFPVVFLLLLGLNGRRLWQIWQKDARFARTLALEGEQA